MSRYLEAVEFGERVAMTFVAAERGRHTFVVPSKLLARRGTVLGAARKFLRGYDRLAWLTERDGVVEATKR